MRQPVHVCAAESEQSRSHDTTVHDTLQPVGDAAAVIPSQMVHASTVLTCIIIRAL